MSERANVTAYLCAKGAAEAIEFYGKAFGATERYRIADDNGRIGHAEIDVGETMLMISDEAPELDVLSPASLGGAGVSFVLTVPDVDAAWEQAVEAGATIVRPMTEAPYGRGGWVRDPYGFRWNIMTPNPDFKPEDMTS